jgi:adenylylsulfate kinase
MIVMMAGLPGSGKSTLAQAVAERVDGLVLDKDLVRARLFPPEAIAYSTAQDDSVVQHILGEAESLLRIHPDRVIFLDGRPFSQKYQVDMVVDFAQRIGTSCRIVECVCPEDVALLRLKGDSSHVAGNRNAELYQWVKSAFQPIRQPKLVVQTTLSLEDCVNEVEKYLLVTQSPMV